MCTDRLALVFRSVAIIIFSFAVVSCGSGSGKPTVNSSDGTAVGSQALRLVFEDDFGGSIGAPRLAGKTALPTSNWRLETGYGDNGWGNDEWQNYTNSTDNVYLENGTLVVSAQCSTGGSCSDVGVNKRTGAITSARINSKNKLHVRYGSVSARIKMPSGIGTWPAFWMLGADIDELRWPDAGEIDIVEMHYKFSDTKTTHFTTHWSAPNYAAGENPTCSGLISGVNPGEQQHCFTNTKTFNTPLTDDFHVFELVWDENSITGKIDDVTYYTLGIDPGTMEEFLKDYFMILNVAVGGTLGGTPGATMDWTNPDQTNMLVDWVRVYERGQPDSSTLIDESGNNLPYNRIINSAELGGAFVNSDLESIAVAPLVSDNVLELDYATSVSQNGGATAGFSGAFFSFNRIDLSNFNNIIFSMDVSQFANFDNVSILFEDSGSGAVSVNTGNLTPIATVGNWNTYKIPFSDYAGVAMDDIKFVAFANPNDVNNNLISGKMYLDDIRFSQEECIAQGVITFDSADYNPDTRVGAVNIDDVCAAGSLASIEVDNGSEQITLGVKLDAAGKGRVTFGLVNGASVCLVDDQESILPLSGALTATYTKTSFEGTTPTIVVVTDQAGVDVLAPGTMLAGDELFLYSTDQALTFLPDNDFAYSVFGSGSLLNGAASDTTFNPSFGVTSGTGYGGGIHVAQIIWLGGGAFPGFAGFADGKASLNFKIRDLPSNSVKVEVGVAGAGVDLVDIIDVTSSAFSTPIGSTGWYQIVIPFSEFPASSAADFIAITAGNGGTSAFTFLITDVAVQESLSNVPASCEVLTGGGGMATGGSVPDATIYEADGSTADLSPAFDPFGSATGITTVADTSYTQALELTVANGYAPTLALAQLGLTGLSFTGYDEFLFKVKGLTADNTIKVTADATGGGTVTIDLTSAPSGVTATDLGDGWTQVVIALTAFGDVSSTSQVVFQTLDNAYAVGDTFLLTDIGFNNAGGGGGGQLAVNGDLETGDLSSWTLNLNGGSITADNTQNSGSTWSTNIVAGPGTNPSISLAGLGVGAVMPGDTIDISFDMCGSLVDGGEVAFALLSEFGGGSGATRDEFDRLTTIPPVWTRYNYQTTAGGDVTGGVSLQFDVICGGVSTCLADVYLDNASVTIGGGPVAGSASGNSCVVVVPPVATTPTVAAATPPARAPVDVISLFSNAYTDVTVDTWVAGFSATSFADVLIAGNDTKEYTAFGFAGIELLNANSVDITGMTHFHFDIWTSNVPDFLFKVVNFNGAGGFDSESVFTINAGSTPALAQGSWVSVDIPITQLQTFGLGVTPNDVSQLIIDGIPDGGAVYLDNVYFYNSAGGLLTMPPVAAPTPQVRVVGDVISLFSNAYTNVTVDTWAAGFSATSFADVQIAGNDTKEYTAFGFAGVELLGANSVDITGMTHFHFDIWTPDVPDFLFKVVNFNGAGGFESESVTTINAGSTPALTQGSWIGVDIPITQLQTDGLGATPNDVSQLIIDGTPDGGAVYLDNVYFYKPGAVTVPPAAAPAPPARAPADVISLFSNTYTNVTVDTWAAGFSNTSFSDVQIAGDDTKEYTAFGFAGIELLGANSVDITGMTHFHFDIWTPDVPDFLFKVVNFNGAGGFESESVSTINAVSTPALAQGSWVSVDIPITQLQTDGLGATPNDVSQLIIDGTPDGGAVYLDNVYFYTGGGVAFVNGDFETGDFTGWTQVPDAGTNVTPGTITLVTSAPGSRVGSVARLEAAGDGVAGSQDVLLTQDLAAGTLNVGATIDVSFDLYGSLAGAGGVVFVELIYLDVNGSDIGNRSFVGGGAPKVPTTTWSTYSDSIVVPAVDVSGGVRVQLKSSCGPVPGCGVDAYFDNVSVTITP